MPATLSSLITALSNDPGLVANVSTTERQKGLDAAAALNALLLKVIEAKGLNADGWIRPEEMSIISTTMQGNAVDYLAFLRAHGDDEGNLETGFHLLQNDGGTLKFRGRMFVDTVADAIYHYAFDIVNGRYVNEDGNENELARDVAGWLNYFLNGKSAVYGTEAAESLGSGEYSSAFAAARNETFWAGGGNDSIWADLGNDTVYGGDGYDVMGGGEGYDRLYGEEGRDVLYGDEGHDRLYGGASGDKLGGGSGDDLLDGGTAMDTLYGETGNDTLLGGDGDDLMGGGEGHDSMVGGTGNDTFYGDAGNDLLYGEDGDDLIYGSDGGDRLYGRAGNDKLDGGASGDRLYGSTGADTLYAGEGADLVVGGADRDLISLWENTQSRDTLIFYAGDSGRTRATIDRVEGFEHGIDKIDLTPLGPMTFEDIDFRGGGASCFYDGKYLRIDTNGDRATDMMVEFAWVEEMTAADFILA